MADFEVMVRKSYAKTTKKSYIVEGANSLTVAFSFSSDWDELTKVAVFTDGLKTITRSNISSSITIPWEVCFNPTRRVRVGLYGLSGQSEVIPTVWTDLNTVAKSPDASADPSTDPTLPVWADLSTQIANRYTKAVSDSKYETIADSDLVRARVTVVESALSGKSSVGHTHTLGEVSGLTAALNNKADVSHNHDNLYYTEAEMDTLLAAKQNTISDLATIRSGAALGATALQEHQSLAAYRTSAAQDVIDAGKQATINDLDTIRSGASLGATALQSVPSTYRTAASQDVIDSAQNSVIATKSVVSVSASGTATDEVQYITINGTEKKLAGSSGGGTWGSITGDLDDQTDLKEALDGKQQTIINDSESYSDPFGDYSSGYDVSIHYVT